MSAIAIYSSKGGVGKTSLAVNLAAIAAKNGRRTLLWDLDGQAAASYILADRRKAHDEARAILEGDIDPDKLILKTHIPGLDLIPADSSLHSLDATFASIDRKKRLARLIKALNTEYDRLILDCPPGLGLTSEQIIRGAALIVLPLIPSSLSQRTLAQLRQHLDQRKKDSPPILPVFNMVDRRRAAHRAALEEKADWSAIPMASVVEMMGDRHAALIEYAPRSAPVQAMLKLWATIERAAKT